MLLNIFSEGLGSTVAVTVVGFVSCLVAALAIGLILARIYIYRNHYTQSFVITLALIPAVVCVTIMMVNGSIGTGIAVAGAFSLVRFRSVPGTAKEIGAIFLAMAAGLATGTGYIGYAFLFTGIVGAVNLIYVHFNFGQWDKQGKIRSLRLTIPENLDYSGLFDDLFLKYTVSHQLVQVRTTNLGSLFKLSYIIKMRDQKQEKEFIDQIRCRNGNLEIMLSKPEMENNESL